MKYYNPRRDKQIFFIVGVATFCAVAATNVSATTIKGNVRYAGTRVEKKTFPVTIDQYLCGKEKEAGDLVLSSANGIRNVVVSLHGVPAGSKAPVNPVPAKMDQKQCVFVPRVVVIPVGGTVEFLNSDRLLHNVRGGGKENPPFNRAQPHARTIAIGFKSPEVLRVDCDLHSWMRGWIVVAEHPFYSVTNEEGEFVFENVPPGKYKLQAWQEILGRVNQEVTVAGEGTQTVTVRMEKK
jgi:plastocyanin